MPAAGPSKSRVRLEHTLKSTTFRPTDSSRTEGRALGGESIMLKSILAVSEGGPDAAMSFRLATRVAGIFDGTVDALHLPVGPAGGMAGGLAMSGEAMPLIMDLDDERLEERATESAR